MENNGVTCYVLRLATLPLPRLKEHSSTHLTGRIYQLGLHGVRRDMATAADHFERASNLGHPGALGVYLCVCVCMYVCM